MGYLLFDVVGLRYWAESMMIYRKTGGRDGGTGNGYAISAGTLSMRLLECTDPYTRFYG